MNNYTKINELVEDIESTRSKLESLISDKGFNLLDPYVIELSQTLDTLVSKYYSLR